MVSLGFFPRGSGLVGPTDPKYRIFLIGLPSGNGLCLLCGFVRDVLRPWGSWHPPSLVKAENALWVLAEVFQDLKEPPYQFTSVQFSLEFQLQCQSFQCQSWIGLTSFRIWNSSVGIQSLPLALFVVILSKALLTSQSRMSVSWWVATPLSLFQSLRFFFV